VPKWAGCSVNASQLLGCRRWSLIETLIVAAALLRSIACHGIESESSARGNVAQRSILGRSGRLCRGPYLRLWLLVASSAHGEHGLAAGESHSYCPRRGVWLPQTEGFSFWNTMPHTLRLLPECGETEPPKTGRAFSHTTSGVGAAHVTGGKVEERRYPSLESVQFALPTILTSCYKCPRPSGHRSHSHTATANSAVSSSQSQSPERRGPAAPAKKTGVTKRQSQGPSFIF